MRKVLPFSNRKIFFIILVLKCFSYTNAQSYIGFLTDNYAGINSVIVNPANIADSRFELDINLMGISAFAGNDYYNMNIFKAISDDNYDFEHPERFYPRFNNNGEGNIDIMGPSFMFNINRTSSIGVFTRARSFVNINGVNGQGLYVIDEEGEDFVMSRDNYNGFGQGWAEVGLSYAQVLINNKENFLKGGLSVKYLKGLGSAYVEARRVSIIYDADGSLHSNGGTTGSFTTTGEVVLGRSADFEGDDYQYKLPIASSGFGFDIGFVYEWRPNHKDYRPRKVWPNRLTYREQNKYKLKVGLSITDIGHIDYKNGMVDIFDFTNTNVSEETIENEGGLYDVLNNIYTLTNSSLGYQTVLPTTFHFNADWNISNNFYLNFNADLSLTAKNKINKSTITDLMTLTPRYESKWLSFYMPLSVIQYVGFQAGAGVRLGPLYLGSGSILTNLVSNKSTGANFYAGLKIPFFHGIADKGRN